ncbi:MAG: MTH938/NDUFAF3 family protein [Euryarchaeota archaeon]|nr:MTH938/NDUFAF3 family protein [Euryarchaeota archaeon]
MIENYRFGRICIDGREYTNDLLIFEGNIKEWWRERGHLLQIKDLEWIIDKTPDALIIGTGAYGLLKVPKEVRDHTHSMGIELKTEKTEKACELYNELRNEKKLGAGLHLTC